MQCNQELDENVVDVFISSNPNALISSHLIRRLSPDEQAFVNEKIGVAQTMSDETLKEAMGETLVSLIEHYPNTTVTRGMVFSRTEIQLKPEDDTTEKIFTRI